MQDGEIVVSLFLYIYWFGLYIVFFIGLVTQHISLHRSRTPIGHKGTDLIGMLSLHQLVIGINVLYLVFSWFKIKYTQSNFLFIGISALIFVVQSILTQLIHCITYFKI